MKLAIMKVILWPKDTKLAPRIISFVPGKINIISGESGTGKSSLTWIIDYCLGSDNCSIPVGLIRDVPGWFGLHIRLANTEMIIARRNPEDQQTTTDLYWNEGSGLSVPANVEKNARVDDLKNRFNQICGLSRVDLSASENVGFGGPASFRDMAAFNFQPQHVVANPYTFFFKTDTIEHREKLRLVFPLALGAIDSNTLAKQRALKDRELEQQQLKRELDARLEAARAWEAEVQSYYLQARTLGLLTKSPSPSATWSVDDYIRELQRVPETVETMDLPDVPEGTNEAAVTELTHLLDEEDRLGQEMSSIRRRLGKLDELSSSINKYGIALEGQEDRLGGIGWFEDKLQNVDRCPVCDSVHPKSNPHLVELKTLARDLRSLTASVHQAPTKLDEEIASLRKELRDREVAISKVRKVRKFQEDASAEMSQRRQHTRQTYLFVGRVAQALENVRSSRNVDDLRIQLISLGQKISELKRDLDPKAQRAKLDATLDTVSAKICNYAGFLHLEHATENIRLNIRELTLQFKRLSGRTDFLWEVGSGQNWVGYHIATLLALHEHFITLDRNPIPDFLVVDQPSQVYFPDAWPSMEQAPGGKTYSSPDIAGVRRIIEALSSFIDAVAGQFQVIVTEHAGSITWDGISHVHLAGNWRKGHDEFLIPAAWLKARENY